MLGGRTDAFGLLVDRYGRMVFAVVAVTSMVAVCLLGLVATVYFVGQHIADFIINMVRDISVTKHDVPQIVCVAVCFVFLASLNMLLRKKLY